MKGSPRMRRLVRILFTLFAAASLLLSLGAIAAGVHSLFRAEKLEYVTEGGLMALLISKHGRLDVVFNPDWPGEPGFTRIRSSLSTMGGTDYNRRVLGFGGGRPPAGGWFVNVPYWFLAAAFAVPP